ncbi:lycopene cyclase domain-containing protein [Halorhabdus salina]|uniref:lycopene cyclase domain-containing protein n=1 Tax=Halorhabdus salina TaxID=2750670 RepID=UPI0015EEAEB8|nr:lycopene cyclase domain-containing protein [Halorhabdus salina]
MVLTYLQFTLLFVGVPIVALATALFVTHRFHPAQLAGTGLLLGVALVYTLPWDAYLIRTGVWEYGSIVVGHVGAVPYEEVLFIGGQTVLTGLWTAMVVRPDGAGSSVTPRQRAAGVVGGLLVGALGLLALTATTFRYLGAILAWAGPVLALQWGFGWPVLLARGRGVLGALAVPTAYLWVADRLAIGLGLWTFSPTYTTGVTLLGLPIEEAMFFLMTNLFLVQGLVLFGWVVERGALPSLSALLGTVPERTK